ncbi:hypothetical protein QD357_01980 [Rhizobium sp. BR 317]|uniref:hypothetical protein n=1 Tax=Rhizobium sp. BR 317 TaxID=3040015 RepID=UPI0039BF25EF
MLYNQPFDQPSNPNAPYVNGNPSSGIQGSIIPAAAVEYPQREIIALIQAAGFTPSNSDLSQAAKAIQSGLLNFAIAGGTANALTATLSPVPASLVAGLIVVLNITTPNTGAATLNLNGLGNKSIVNIFGAALIGGELIGPVSFTYDGTKWWASVAQPALSANRTYYVNGAGGNDGNNGLTAGTAFATIQRAIDVTASLNCNGFAISISVASGTYGAFNLRSLAGASSATLTGDTVTPSNVITGAIGAGGSTGWKVEGLKPTVTGAGAHNLSVSGGSVTVGNMEWPLNNNSGGSNGGAHMASGAGGTIFITGTQRIVGGATIAHMYAADGGAIRAAASQPTLNVVNVVGFTAFVNAVGGFINCLYSSITGAANVNNGLKYSVSVNGSINTNGAGVNYYPGPTAGTTATGGQYV